MKRENGRRIEISGECVLGARRFEPLHAYIAEKLVLPFHERIMEVYHDVLKE